METPPKTPEKEKNEQKETLEIPGLKLLEKAGFFLHELSTKPPRAQEYEATKTIKGISGREHTIKIIIQPYLNKARFQYSCKFEVEDFGYLHQGNDFSLEELTAHLAKTEGLAYYEKPIRQIPAHTKEYEENFRDKYKKLAEELTA